MSIRPRITVVGTGYLGASHAASMAELGYDVLGVDVDESKIAALTAGKLLLFEPELELLLRKHLESGRLRFTTSYRRAADFGDVHFVCVGTPPQAGSAAADLRFIDTVIEDLVPCLTHDALIVGKSTVPVGTAERLAKRISELAPVGLAVELAWNPELVREGYAVKDTLHPDRIVFGVKSAAAEAALRDVYAPMLAAGVPVVVTDFPTAELVKVSANLFFATKLSFINAMVEVCEVTGADVTKLSEALSRDKRIGERFLHAGLGFDGGCLPKDIRAFMARIAELGADEALRFLCEVDAINIRRRARVMRVVNEPLMGASSVSRWRS
jgi:UDPglucose 6-dehydrogenase